jgi:hypothetical protein
VIPKTCDSCQQQGTEKPSSLYWAWNRADGQRVAYLQKLCFTCFCTTFLPLIAPSLEPLLACPACGISTADGYDAVYVKVFVPGAVPYTLEMPLCDPCAADVRSRAQRGARQLEDREAGSLGAARGPQPVTATQTWASLGIVPR